MPKSKGFTLIELLVVVLIIGILTAIALPRYEIAVAKTKLVKAIQTVNELTQAQERYFLATGKYADDINDLDISMGNLHGNPGNYIGPDSYEYKISSGYNYNFSFGYNCKQLQATNFYTSKSDLKFFYNSYLCLIKAPSCSFGPCSPKHFDLNDCATEDICNKKIAIITGLGFKPVTNGQYLDNGKARYYF